MTISAADRTLEQAAASSTSLQLFSGLTREQRTRILHSAQHRRFRPNRVIVRADEPVTHFYLLVKGRVKYFRLSQKGEEIVLGWLVHGNAFGVGAMLKDSICNLGTAQTINHCELLVWSQEKIRELASAYKQLTENALRIVLYYLSLYTEKVVGLATQTAKQRLAHTLIQLSRRTGEVRHSGVQFEITNEELGGLASVGIFTVSRQLKEWERRGVIEKGRGRINLLSPEGLLID